jgi:hypothetical protein
MTSPLAQFANARILFKAPGARTSGRDGFKVAEGQAYLIQAFLKRRALPGVLDDRLGLPAINGMPLEWQGYVVSFAPISSAEADAFDSIDIAGLAFDESMLLPPEVRRDSKGTLSVPGHELIEVRFTDKAGKFGTEGIGGIIRGVLGDSLFLEGGQIG